MRRSTRAVLVGTDQSGVAGAAEGRVGGRSVGAAALLDAAPWTGQIKFGDLERRLRAACAGQPREPRNLTKADLVA